MKKFTLLSALLLFFSIIFAQTNFTATYNFAGSGNDVSSFNYNGDIFDGVNPTALLKVGISSSGSNNNFRGSNWPTGATNESDDFAGNIDLEKYLSFSIEPVSGYTFTITSIKFGIGRSATGPRQYEWRGNYDNFASTLSNYDVVNELLNEENGVLTTPDGNASWLNNILSLGTNYANLSTLAEFRLYAYNSETTGGTAGLQGNLIIEGSFTETGEAGLSIITPANNITIYENEVEVSFSTVNFELGTDGKLEYILNSEDAAYVTESPFTISDLEEGENTIFFQLVDMDEEALVPVVTANRTIIYEVPVTDPSLTITSPENNTTLNTNQVSISFTTENFVLGTDGKLEYILNSEDAAYVTESPFTILDLEEGENTILFQLVDMDEEALDPAVTASLTVSYEIPIGPITENIETFDNSNITPGVNYSDGSFIGYNNIEWTYFHCRDTGAFPIDGKGIILRRASEPSRISANIPGGIGSLSFDIRKAFTSNNQRKIEVLINDEIVEQFEPNLPSGASDEIINLSIPNINMNGNVDLMIRLYGTVDINQQVTIDNIAWTSFAGTEPNLIITSPANNAIVNENEVELVFSTQNFVLGTDGKLEYILNSENAVYLTESPFTISGLEEGENTILFQLVDMDENALEPAVTANRTITYEIISTDPALTINSPHNGASIYSEDISINFTVENFELGVDGKLAYKLDEEAIQYYTGSSPLNLTGLEYGTHQIYFELVDMTETSLDPEVVVVLNFTNHEPIPGGMETFDNATIGGSYTDGSFVGNDDITWTYKHSRDEGDYPINGKGLMLRNSMESSIESEVLSDGIASFEVKFRKAFTGVSERNLELYINNELKGTSEIIGSSSGENPTIYSFSVGALNVPGDFVIKIKIAGDDNINRQITIDDISWTGYAGTEPYLAINSPQNGQIFYESNVNVNYTTTNFNLGVDGKAKYIIDDAEPVYTINNPIILTELEDGEHNLSLELVNMDNEPYSPAIIRTVNFFTNTAGPDLTSIYDIQYTTDASGDSPLKGQNVWVKGVVSANFNGSQYGEGYYLQQGAGAWNGIYIYDLVNSPQVGDSVLVAGKVEEAYGLTEIKGITFYEVIGVDGIIAPAVELSTSLAGSEAYEGCLVKVSNAECTQTPNNFGEWIVNDGSGNLMLKENGVSTITATIGAKYDITGVIYYGYNEFSLQYRSDNDIVISNINEDFANSLNLYPNPANNFINISSEFGVENIKIFNSLGQTVLEQNAKSDNININIEDLESGVYFIKIVNKDRNAVLRFIKE